MALCRETSTGAKVISLTDFIQQPTEWHRKHQRLAAPAVRPSYDSISK
jgi:hypothetical protein